MTIESDPIAISVPPPPLVARMTVAEAVACLQTAFCDIGLDEPGRDARLLAQHVLGLAPGGHILHADKLIGSAALPLAAATARRLAREPISRIVGTRGFYGRQFTISPATLDPRPDTEALVEAALGLLAESAESSGSLRLLDIGTGSGCILVTLLAERPSANGVGTDISPEALAVADANARNLGVSARATWTVLRSSIPGPGPYDLIAANPPYIRTADLAGLEPEVRLYDPLAALDGGPDGLAVYREILGGLNPDVLQGWLVFEVGHDQADSVALLMTNALGLQAQNIRRFTDLNGHTRCVAARSQW